MISRTLNGPSTYRQDRPRHRVEPRARLRQRARARAGRLPGGDLRARRGAPGRGRRRVARAASRPDQVLPVQADVSTAEGVEQLIANAPSTRSAASTSSSTTSAWPAARRSSTRPTPSGRRRSTRRCFPAIRASRAGRAAHAAARRRRDRDDRVDLGTRVGRPHDLQRRQGRRDQPGEVDGAAAGARQHPRQQRRARLDSVPGRIVAPSVSRTIPRASPTSSRASCRSGASAAPRKSGRSSRSSRRRARAGSAARVCPLTAASHGPSSNSGAGGWGTAITRTPDHSITQFKMRFAT